MIVAILDTLIGLVPVLEFRSSADINTAVTEFCGEYNPPKDTANYHGVNADGLDLNNAPIGGWHYDHDLSEFTYGLEILKDYKKKSIDDRTEELINMGFPYSGRQFGLDPSSKLDWLGIKVMKAELAMMNYFPYTIIDMDGAGYLLELLKVEEFLLTGLGVYSAHISSGAALKDQVNNATTKEEIESIEDNR